MAYRFLCSLNAIFLFSGDMVKNRGPWLELFRSTWLGSQLSDAVSWDSNLAGLGIGCIRSGIAASTDDPSKVADCLGPAGSTS